MGKECSSAKHVRKTLKIYYVTQQRNGWWMKVLRKNESLYWSVAVNYKFCSSIIIEVSARNEKQKLLTFAKMVVVVSSTTNISKKG